ncbi:MAG: hypothetical protein QOC96_108 [Acidobacteriota bacterium]|jgi:hypothetical protein|nr:hypothetical protein [Acidobacteriota bacterium]
MKIKIVLLTALLLAFSSIGFAQSNAPQQLRRSDPQMQSTEQKFGQEKVTVSFDKSIPLSTRQALVRYLAQHYDTMLLGLEIDKVPGADHLYAITGAFSKAQLAKDSAQAPTILLVLREQGDTVSEVSKIENDNGSGYGLLTPAFFLGDNKLLIIVSLSSVDGDARLNLVYEYADSNFKPLGQIDVIEKVGMNGNLWRIANPVERATAKYQNNTYYVTVRGASGGLYDGSVDANGSPQRLALRGSPVTFFYEGGAWKQAATNR